MILADTMRVTVPEGESRGMCVRRFTVGPPNVDLNNLRCALDGRPCKPGEYTMLVERGPEASWDTVWMSDTTAERHDHLLALYAIEHYQAKRVLINGLGLGMVLQAALVSETVEQIDVVETDQRVIALVGPHYQTDPRVRIFHADAYAQAKSWPAGSRWDVAWHDIWPHLSSDNLEGMTRLHRSYGRRVRWQGSWCQAECRRIRSTHGSNRLSA